MSTCTLQMVGNLFENIKENALFGLPMLEAGTRTGGVVICGAGPSLTQYEGAPLPTREIWGCNSAATWLSENGLRITHAFAIDQSEGMLEEWATLKGGDYLLASSVSPRLIEQVRSTGGRIKLFHSYLGIPDPEDWNPSPCPWPTKAKKTSLVVGGEYEMHLYKTLYPTSIRVGHGLNSVPRAVCLALAMGFSDIKVYGADCAALPNQPEMPETGEQGYWDWMQGITLYADGRKASVYGESVMCEAVIDGKRWTTRADMVISAMHLLELQQAFPDRITLVGDTLPNALRGKPQAFWDRSPKLGDGEVTNFRTTKEAVT